MNTTIIVDKDIVDVSESTKESLMMNSEADVEVVIDHDLSVGRDTKIVGDRDLQ